MPTTIREFCEERKLTKQMEDAFVMYCRSTYAEKFMLRNGDTVRLLTDKMTREQVLEAWSDFVREMKNLIAE